MKRFILALAAIMLFAATAQAQGKFITEFKGIPFGKELSPEDRMSPADKRGDLTLYKRYGDDRTFQGVALKDLFYGYARNKFCLVMFSAQGPSAFNAIKTYLDSNYGPASQPKVNIKQYSYTAGEVSVELGYDDTRKVVEVSYVYKPVMRQLTGGK